MRDLRKYSQQTIVRLIIGFILLLFLVGLGLIYIFYGQQATLFGLLCLLAGLAPLVLIWLTLELIDRIAKRSTKD